MKCATGPRRIARRRAAGLRDAVGVEEEHIAGAEGHRDLLINIGAAKAERHVLALQQGVSAAPAAGVDRPRVAAVDQVQLVLLQVEAGVAERDEALDAFELFDQFLVDDGEDFLRLGHLAGVRRQEMIHRAEDVVLGRRPHQGGRDTLAHHVADDDIEVLVVRVEIIEIAVNAHGGNRHRGRADQLQIERRLAQEKRLLDARGNLDVPLQAFALQVRTLEAVVFDHHAGQEAEGFEQMNQAGVEHVPARFLPNFERRARLGGSRSAEWRDWSPDSTRSRGPRAGPSRRGR